MLCLHDIFVALYIFSCTNIDWLSFTLSAGGAFLHGHLFCRSITLKPFTLILRLGFQVPECSRRSQSFQPNHLAVQFPLQTGWTHAKFKLLKISVKGDFRDLPRRTASHTYLPAIYCRVPPQEGNGGCWAISLCWGRWGTWHMVLHMPLSIFVPLSSSSVVFQCVSLLCDAVSCSNYLVLCLLLCQIFGDI